MSKEEDLKKYSKLIEMTLASFNIGGRIAKVNDYKNCTQYCLDLELGTPIQNILKLDKDIALSLASPTGSVEIQAPIPHSSLIGITVPKHEKYNKQERGKLLHSYTWNFEHTDIKPVKGWRQKTSNFIYVIGYLIIELSKKINKKH